VISLIQKFRDSRKEMFMAGDQSSIVIVVDCRLLELILGTHPIGSRILLKQVLKLAALESNLICKSGEH
jgi:hypothetical protein